MLDTRIKICGITTPEDAELCQSTGADYLGVIFADSPRQVTTDTALAIRRAVPDAMLVGVFVNAPAEEAARVAHACELNLIQLHGQETPEYCETLARLASLPIIKSVGTNFAADPKRMREYKRTSYFLFDLDKNQNGASRNPSVVNLAQEQLWERAAEMRQKGFRIFLAGSLNAANVNRAVKAVQPYCIDVATGVEKAPGVKDAAALKHLIREVRS